MSEEDVSSSNLTLRLLRALDKKLDAFREEMNEFREEMSEFKRETTTRLDIFDGTVGEMARHFYWLTGQVRKIDRRVHKLEE